MQGRVAQCNSYGQRSRKGCDSSKMTQRRAHSLSLLALRSLAVPALDAYCALQRYPEFARKLLYEETSPEFLEATDEWQKAYGKV